MDTFTTFVKRSGGVQATAKKLGVSAPTIQKWRNGTRRPRPEQALEIERLSGGDVPKEHWYWPESEAAA